MKKALALILHWRSPCPCSAAPRPKHPKTPPTLEGTARRAAAGAFVGNESDEYYMVSFLSGIDYWKHCFEGMEDAGNALGVTTKYTGQTDSDVAGQVAVLEQVIAQSPKGIAVTCVNSAALVDTTVTSSPRSRGILWRALTPTLPPSDRSSYLSTGNSEATALPLSTWYPCAEGRVRLPSSIPWAPRTAKAVLRALRPGAPKTPLASRS